ncbi:hypothetical protein DNI29_22090 [Hymenobacter sediminis]|uniref:hypothetical protein n=1 Tax=Hymenobacter sediminis TaxID=2218621 RepID=UPI000F4F4AD5|nr:hypothetical protein [Hymenobacter sediminis]RPD44092.1 hypothetical protein DNI29_22090 [Hymenobacter sediminis]
MNTYTSHPAGELWARPEGYLHLIWGPGSQDSQAAQALFDEVVCLLQVTGYRKLLTDQRLRAPATKEYLGWLLVDWLPRVGIGRLLAQVAIVAAKPLELRLQVGDICTEGQQRYGILTYFFATTEEASRWLQQPELLMPST